MRILAIDTATELGTVAFVEVIEGRFSVLAEASASVDARHGETLLPHLEDVVKRAGLTPRDIEMVAVGLGPGSFTGVRVGLATAKGLALGLGVPVVGIGTLDIVAASVPGDHVVVALDAKKDEVFAARYARRDGALVRTSELVHGAHAAIAAMLEVSARDTLVGSGARDTRFGAPPGTLADPASDAPRAALLAELAARASWNPGPSDLRTLVPLYVRGADAVVPASLVPFAPKSER